MDHGLIARSVLTVGEAVEIVDTQSEVKAEVAEEMGGSTASMEKSLALLGAIRVSLGHDLPGSGQTTPVDRSK